MALRWRTEAELLSGAGEETCGNTRCAYHEPQSERALPPLKTLEVPFAYSEHGEAKSALVKLVLCERCSNKLLWKRRKEKAAATGKDIVDPSSGNETDEISNVDAEPHRSGAEQRRHSVHHNDRDAVGHGHRYRTAQSMPPAPRRSPSRGLTGRNDVTSGQSRKDRRRRQSRSRSMGRRSASPELRARGR